MKLILKEKDFAVNVNGCICHHQTGAGSQNRRVSGFGIVGDKKRRVKMECETCKQGQTPMMLDEDGILCIISRKPGILSHTSEDYFWRCEIDKYKRKYRPLKSKQAEADRVLNLINLPKLKRDK